MVDVSRTGAARTQAERLLRYLEGRKAKLDVQIRQEHSRTSPCAFTLQKLKKLKLRLKDRISMVLSRYRHSGLSEA